MPTILVVDDEESIRKLYKEELEEQGYEIILASSGEEAINFYRQNDIDLIVMDIRMEKKSGIEALKEIMQENKNVKVIINTAYTNFKFDFTSWLADAYLIKSSDLNELKEKIRELLT